MRSILIFFMMMIIPAMAFAGESYTPPDVNKARMVLEEKQFLPSETQKRAIDIISYKNPDGTLFRTYSVKGKVFRYDIDTDKELPYEYRLLDKDGDGSFETKESLIVETESGDKRQKLFIDLGPEPGKEYQYTYERFMKRVMHPVSSGEASPSEQRDVIMGYPFYIPQWVILNWQ